MLNTQRVYLNHDVSGHGRFTATIYCDNEFAVMFNPTVTVKTMSPAKQRRKKDGTIVEIPPEPRNFMLESIRFSFGPSMVAALKEMRQNLEQGFDEKQYVNKLFRGYGKMALKNGQWEASDSVIDNFEIVTLPPHALEFVHKAVGWCLDKALEDFKTSYEAYSEIVNISFTKLVEE